MLKWVWDQVLQARNIIQAFAASGMCPLNFEASYAYEQVPPWSLVATVEEERINSDIGEGDRDEIYSFIWSSDINYTN